MADEPQYTDAQLADGTTLRFQGQLSPLEVKQRVTAYRAGLPSADSQSHNQLASTSMNKVDPMTGGQVTPQEEQVRDNYSHQAQNNIHTPVTNASLIYAAPVLGSTPLASVGKFANSVGRGIFGDVIGRFGARELGADEDTQNLAGLALGTLGSVTGYKEPPARVGFGRYSFGVPDALRPDGAAQEAQQSIGAFMNRGYKPAPVSPEPLSPNYTATNGVRDTPFTLPSPSASAVSATTSTPVQYAGAGSVTSGETAINGSVARPAGSLIKTPEELRSFDQMMSIAKRNASERGMQFAGGMVPAEGRKVPYTPTATTYDPFSSSRGTTQFDEFGNPIKRNQ